MKRGVRIFVSAWMIFLAGSTPGHGEMEGDSHAAPGGIRLTHLNDAVGEVSEGHCTIIYASNDEMALAGGNEDWDDPTGRVRFVPPEDGKYGIVYFGFATSGYEAGMNDQGLFFDAAATPPLEVVNSKHKISSGRYPVIEVMETSATVEEALQVFNKYNLAFMEDFQLMFGDRFGNSAILEGDEVIYKKGRYQILTNFYQSQLPEGFLPGHRYRTAQRMFENVSELSVELFKLILEATHQEGRNPTVYSNIYDLKNRIVYVFYQHDFDHVLEINLEKMLAQGPKTYDLSAIFSTLFSEASPLPLVQKEEPVLTPTLAEQAGHDTSGRSFWMGIVPPLVVLILLLGGRAIRGRRLDRETPPQ